MNPRCDVELHPGLPDILAAYARQRANPALIVEGREHVRLSYSELWARTGYGAALLRERGVRARDRVALSMASTADVVIALVALMRIGATIVPVRPRASMQIDGHEDAAALAALRVSGARWSVVEERAADTQRARLASAGLAVAVLATEAVAGAPGAAVASDATALVRPETAVESLRDDELAMLLQFSSGSTSAPKGILLTRGNVNANVAAIVERLAGDPDRDVTLSWLPLYHDMGLVGTLLATLHCGGTLVLMPPVDFLRNPLGWLEALSRYRATVTSGPQFAYDLCVAKAGVAPERARGLDLSALRVALNGSEAVDWVSCRDFQLQFAGAGLAPNVLQPGYGLAENAVAVTMRLPGTPVPVRHLDRTALAEGRALPSSLSGAMTLRTTGNGATVRGTVAAILGSAGEELPDGRVGQIHIAGTSAARQIVDSDGRLRPAASMPHGLVPTGDLGVMLDGELYVVGRIKEILKYGGRTFAPADIERTVFETSGVDTTGVAAVVVRGEGSGGDELVVLVEHARPRDGEPDRSVADLVRLAVLRAFQVPVRDVLVVRRGSLPRTSSGKIKRVLLGDAYRQARLSDYVPVIEPAGIAAAAHEK